MIAIRVVDIYAMVMHRGEDYKVKPDGRVLYWLGYADVWYELDKGNSDYEAIREAGLKAINEDKQ
jgi:hypothetical protein